MKSIAIILLTFTSMSAFADTKDCSKAIFELAEKAYGYGRALEKNGLTSADAQAAADQSLAMAYQACGVPAYTPQPTDD